MARSDRVVSVTLRLIGLGAVAGAACGAVIVPGIMLVTGFPGELLMPGLGRLLALGAGIGAAVGSVAGPAVAWGLLREVPLGRAVLWGAVGTVGGALAGELFTPFNADLGVRPGVLGGALVGLIGASAVLRLLVGRGSRRSVPELPNVR